MKIKLQVKVAVQVGYSPNSVQLVEKPEAPGEVMERPSYKGDAFIALKNLSENNEVEIRRYFVIK